jgi:hypothetical protein
MKRKHQTINLLLCTALAIVAMACTKADEATGTRVAGPTVIPSGTAQPVETPSGPPNGVTCAQKIVLGGAAYGEASYGAPSPCLPRVPGAGNTPAAPYMRYVEVVKGGECLQEHTFEYCQQKYNELLNRFLANQNGATDLCPNGNIVRGDCVPSGPTGSGGSGGGDGVTRLSDEAPTGDPGLTADPGETPAEAAARTQREAEEAAEAKRVQEEAEARQRAAASARKKKQQQTKKDLRDGALRVLSHSYAINRIAESASEKASQAMRSLRSSCVSEHAKTIVQDFDHDCFEREGRKCSSSSKDDDCLTLIYDACALSDVEQRVDDFLDACDACPERPSHAYAKDAKIVPVNLVLSFRDTAENPSVEHTYVFSTAEVLNAVSNVELKNKKDKWVARVFRGPNYREGDKITVTMNDGVDTVTWVPGTVYEESIPNKIFEMKLEPSTENIDTCPSEEPDLEWPNPIPFVVRAYDDVKDGVLSKPVDFIGQHRNLGANGWNDEISAIKIFQVAEADRGYVSLYEDHDFNGEVVQNDHWAERAWNAVWGSDKRRTRQKLIAGYVENESHAIEYGFCSITTEARKDDEGTVAITESKRECQTNEPKALAITVTQEKLKHIGLHDAIGSVQFGRGSTSTGGTQ